MSDVETEIEVAQAIFLVVAALMLSALSIG